MKAVRKANGVQSRDRIAAGESGLGLANYYSTPYMLLLFCTQLARDERNRKEMFPEL
jgi:hypothetical protein